ncbi:MAG: TIGR04282 family arsenosugar biosynthesis glycosyltransferase [Candidatus Nitricoxidivorans perseverans]|uniref:TIGR04282 family arsenosugar biosynthesis glycosyltransferase n=1 Tax=Candidatus Nitricoxidivorans perseverans TaxID=2975601 RepID=A0AA49FMS0_9PROT|nr:MAG: TIGR04282 family arsenosugar biosynthesis glycosyltransferase [Candidatus Nitricoxidivorans perseverans]
MPRMIHETGIAVLARAPVPGKAKTRLIPALGAEGAAELQRRLIRHALTTARAAAIGPVTLWLDGGMEASCLSADVTVRPQPTGDLGARMLAAIAARPGTLVIGTDCPALTAAHLHQAAHSLSDHDAVLLPAEDGGYVLIGMRTPAPEPFADIDWGTDRVMAQTRARLAALGWRWEEPATLWDVDRPADLDRLAQAGFPSDVFISGRRSPTRFYAFG